MKAVKMKDNIYWVGAIDWSLRNFHGYKTGHGATYNSYLIIDDKITLIDTVKHGFEDEMLSRISSVIDPTKIDYIISSHVEMDHSGGLPFISRIAPDAKIITSFPNGQKGLTAHYGNLNYQAVKAGDTINIGKRTLSFVTTPMLHWPDSMVTYCPEEKILFSNDAFGQHFASTERFDSEIDLPLVLWEAKKYFANILMPYGKQAQAALKALAGYDIEMILTGHGISWKNHINDILSCYESWSRYDVKDRAVIVFDSMWHSTEIMAKTITDAFAACGIPAVFYDLKTNELSDIVTELFDSKYLAVGSPTINNQMMPTVAAFLCYLKGLQPKNHKAFAFGSYGWGGQSIKLVEEDLKAAGCEICLENIRNINVPSENVLKEIEEKIIQAIK